MHPIEPAISYESPESPALATLWNLVCSDLSLSLGQAEFERWFSAVKLVRMDAGNLCFSAPNTIYTLWIEENYLDPLQAAIARHLPTHPPIRFEIASPVDIEAIPESESLSPTESESPADPIESDQPEPVATRSTAAETEPAPFADNAKIRQAGLRKEHTFDKFVIGLANRLAAAAAKAVAEKPGKTYHPLFIYSVPGLGKTHLLQAIGWESLKRRPKSRVVYITAEIFANEYIEAIQKNNLVAFRKRYREADVLLIDDIQFLSGKGGMQTEFFHTFNTLTDRHKQIVLASDRPAGEIRDLEERLVSRFNWGMTAEIAAPERETRLAILRQKRDERGAKTPDWICEFIADRVTSNVRALEGALIRIATIASLNGQNDEITPTSLEELLQDFVDEKHTRQIGVPEILTVVAEHYGLPTRDLTGKRRTGRLVEARHIGMFLARELTDLSLAEIGKDFGGRDHGTVINACRRIAAKTDANPGTRRTADFLRRALLTLGGPAGRSRSAVRDRPFNTPLEVDE